MNIKYKSFLHLLPMLLATLTLCSGCEQSIPESPTCEGETTTLTLHVGTHSPSLSVDTKAEDANVLPYEGLRTVRVIITYDNNTRIGYNQKFTVDNSSFPATAQLETTLTLEDVPVGNANIYVIANEESLDMEYTDEVLQENSKNQKLLVVDVDRSYFPKRYEDIAAHGLPMSQKLENQSITAQTNSLSIALDRAVVKLHLTVENATASDLTLQWVKFGPFISDRFFMFREVNLDIPEGTNHKELQYGSDDDPMNVTLQASAKTEWNPVYIYPNNAETEAYTLTLKTGVKEYGASLGSNLSFLVRNTQLNILARITATATINISYEYIPWEEVKINVPSFN